MNRTQDRSDHRSGSERQEIRVRRAILLFVTGHPYSEMPPPVATPGPVNARNESRAERGWSVQR